MFLCFGYVSWALGCGARAGMSAALARRGGCTVSYVYDGDTVALGCGAREVTARLQGFDAPETKAPRCAAEAALGRAATARLREMVGAADEVRYRHLGHDKYGRALIRLELDGREAGAGLVAEGLAVAYAGGARVNWCERLGQ